MLNIGVSACLLGIECRFDGGHKRDDFINDELSAFATFHRFCPEDEILGHPRESIRLVNDALGIKAIGNKTQNDYTEQLTTTSKNMLIDIQKLDLDGFILKSKSPSCGLERVKLYLSNGMTNGSTSGIFAKTILDALPYLPIEEEGRLQDSWLRENFLLQLFAYKDLKETLKTALKLSALIEFHTAYKYLILSKSQKHYKLLGKIVANTDKLDIESVKKSYFCAFCEAISIKNSRGKTVNVLEHMVGFIKNELNQKEKSALQKSFKQFKDGIIPLIVPIKLLELYIEKFDVSYLKGQRFLNPYPESLALRSELEAFK